jgi:hypothetical protein
LTPTFVHLAPALTAALAGTMGRDSESIDKNAITLLFIYKA